MPSPGVAVCDLLPAAGGLTHEERATYLIAGINSDLPGRITAQVSQNVYDSATGHQLLIPQAPNS